jgi:hypothetical protein
MPPTQDLFLKLRNHGEVRRILDSVAAGADLSWFDQAAIDVCKRWFRLGQHHLQIAKRLQPSPRDWRSIVSRSYYAAYNASKCVRYYVNGSVKLDADDHKHVGDLPDDFPQRAYWSTFLVELRHDRNLADYEPWDHVRKSLTYPASTAVGRTTMFLQQSKHYLKGRGVVL